MLVCCGGGLRNPDASPAFRVPSPIVQTRSVRVYRDVFLGVTVVSLAEFGSRVCDLCKL